MYEATFESVEKPREVPDEDLEVDGEAFVPCLGCEPAGVLPRRRQPHAHVLQVAPSRDRVEHIVERGQRAVQDIPVLHC